MKQNRERYKPSLFLTRKKEYFLKDFVDFQNCRCVLQDVYCCVILIYTRTLYYDLQGSDRGRVPGGRPMLKRNTAL